MRVGWHNWVVINSPVAVKEILDKQVGQTATSIFFKTSLVLD